MSTSGVAGVEAVQRDRLVVVVEDAAGGQVIAVERDGHQPPRDRLCRTRERLLALALAKIELRQLRHGDLNHPVGQLARNQLMKPLSVESWMIDSNVLEDPMPEGVIKHSCLRIPFRRTAMCSLTLYRRLGRCHKLFF